ncbi:cupin domain-containing protein [Paenibacillus sediminis]|uniref:Mannose-6-phosphate isomerase-like protein (Cupin superfamily) n=1 Tax=Paenibacillus sediminis TaxID=664909 RepID=A0ABS4H5J4_9BACL|nr:cupin domain-containing protein [Paenibacillus sediminis]MBP1937802.1 mannose-6-phosphate isomerase-like protein (cupin superfamily) [Paenibacillus sediminis]
MNRKMSKENAEHYIWGNHCDGWHLVNRDDLSVIHERMPAGTSEIRHYHMKSRQFFYILSGTATFEINGEVINLSPQEGIEVAPQVPHQMMNQSNEDIEFLVISHPKSHGDRNLA